MAWADRGTDDGGATAASSFSLPLAGALEGDLMVIDGGQDVDGGAMTVDAAGAAWTTPEESVSGNGVTQTLLYKTAGSSEPSGGFTVNFGSTTNGGGIITNYNPNGATINTIEAGDTTILDDATSEASVTTGAVTVDANGLIHVAYVNDSSFTVDTPPSGLVIVGILLNDVSTPDIGAMSLVVYDDVAPSTGSTTHTAVWSGTDTRDATALTASLDISAGATRRRREIFAFVSMAGPTMSAFGQIFAHSKAGLMIPERQVA